MNPIEFTYVATPARVVFGAGAAAKLAAEVAALGVKRALLISTPGRAKMMREVARGLEVAGVFDRAVMHTPLALVEAARGQAAESKADCCVVIGGGSTIGFGKAIAATSGLPIVAVPTTYSGSEMTMLWGVSDGGLKKTGRDAKVLPKTVIYDPLLTLDLSPATSAASGMNALAHAAEALYAQDTNPVVALIAEEAIRALAASLPVVAKNPRDLEARTSALYGAWLCGMVLNGAGVALHHKLCHVLGGFGLPHAETHSIVLPHALRYNAAAAPRAMKLIGKALGADDAPRGIWELEQRLGLPMKLADVGMAEADIEKAARIAVQAPYPNPRKVEYEPVRELLQNAYEGRKP